MNVNREELTTQGTLKEEMFAYFKETLSTKVLKMTKLHEFLVYELF